ncbi:MULTISPECIES: peptide chain release factor N(5)-glutamine methyltransferase [Acetobacter]|uniref:Release factor glutamine methyltransferase n=2 Tax=Acetobacter TaxID=434 RepID=A0AAN1PHT9_9PROT|nr:MULTISPECIES: peptide chain release factor N(5)-glutamine methyltransferase [Acetobacter]ASL40056.1 protein-(glutamine-N5) methyltransferase, release factor-specific [Acetobacter oryzifermentans]AXN00508.1 protein-(glutamine-N5) methyltransferase, release factor-specific [Acetobacter pomorum]KAA8396970.1 peptide chain release factor N(5)-glutamine methyltransferase [Acetobacter sp. DmW_125128]KAA8399412.1 peptide chain release factor N(5)-glutamine methyltransferase [Acetobacter sp. DmW_1251
MSTAEKTIPCQPIAQLLREGTQLLAQAGIEGPRREARLLLIHALSLTPEQLLARSPTENVPSEPFFSYVKRRAAHEPFAYITGSKGFWSLDLAVSPASLVPRGDTETLITSLLEYRPDQASVQNILDLGTGTGCLLLAALAEYPKARGVGVDINPQAAMLAHANAQRCGMQDHALFIAAEWDAALAPNARFDVVLSNPPYIPTSDLADLMREVREHEPVRALDGGSDGLNAYRYLCGRLPFLLADGGLAVLEIGIGQEEALRALAATNALRVVDVKADLAGIARAVVLEKQA